MSFVGSACYFLYVPGNLPMQAVLLSYLLGNATLIAVRLTGDVMRTTIALCLAIVPTSLRFIVDGKGAYTTVGGERTTMHPGDFIITPSWTWHDHGNEGIGGTSEPVVWLDGLDIPMLRFFDAGFAENDDAKVQHVSRPEGHSLARFGHNMVPVRHDHVSATSPIFNYPYARSREALALLQQQEAPDAWLGHKLRYINPLTGGSPMPTISTNLQLLPKGFAGRRFDFGPRDTFVVPSWAPLELTAAGEDVVLFSFSDRPVQQAMGILREAFLEDA